MVFFVLFFEYSHSWLWTYMSVYYCHPAAPAHVRWRDGPRARYDIEPAKSLPLPLEWTPYEHNTAMLFTTLQASAEGHHMR